MSTAIPMIRHRRGLVVLATLAGVAGVMGLFLSPLGSSTADHIALSPPPSNSSSSSGRRFPLEISPDPVSLGIVRSGQKTSASLTLVNRASRAVTIERIETSCSCLRIAPESIRVGPGERKALALEFDRSAEPDFHGGLSIEVIGYTDADVAFKTLAKLVVQPKPLEGIGKPIAEPDEEAGP